MLAENGHEADELIFEQQRTNGPGSDTFALENLFQRMRSISGNLFGNYRLPLMKSLEVRFESLESAAQLQVVGERAGYRQGLQIAISFLQSRDLRDGRIEILA